MRVLYSPESVKDLQCLHDFVADKSALSARKIALEIQDAVEKLKIFPKIGLPVANSPMPDLVRDLYIGKYILRYQISSSELIYILRIWHNKEVKKDL